MSTASERLEFAPPVAPGSARAWVLAILAHAALVMVLTAGIAWKRESPQVLVQAELWSELPQQAAPPPALAPPATPTPDPTPLPAQEVAKPPPAPEKAAEQPNAAIALAREQARKEKEQQEQLAQAQRLQEKRAQEKLAQEKAALEKARQAKLAQEKQAQEKQAKDKLAKERQAKDKANEKERDQALAQAKKAEAARAQAEAKKLQDMREQNLKRMAGLAGGAGNGEASSSGTAAKSSGPSAGYAGRINARIKPNITYIETVVGNPKVEIEVRTAPDGTILSRRITKASGTKSWDDAALNAIDKTAVLPRDENGQVPSTLILILSPLEILGR